MNSRQYRALVVGAVVGAVVGGFYAVVLVTYRDMIAAKQAGVGPDGKPCKPCEEAKAREALAESPELHDLERTVGPTRVPPAFSETHTRARAIRAEHPEMRWQDAMKAAAATKNETPTAPIEEATE